MKSPCHNIAPVQNPVSFWLSPHFLISNILLELCLLIQSISKVMITLMCISFICKLHCSTSTWEVNTEKLTYKDAVDWREKDLNK